MKENLLDMTDDIEITINDVLEAKNSHVEKILTGDKESFFLIKDLLVAIYIRGFFTACNLRFEDEVFKAELPYELIKARLES